MSFQSQLYIEFKELDATEYREIIAFVETSKKEIRALAFEEQFEIRLTYSKALFETGDYTSYLEHVDELIETTIDLNIKFFHGVDIFPRLLFKKAAALYQLKQYRKAEHILKELIRMNPSNKLPPFLLKKIRLRQPLPVYRHIKAVVILSFLLVAAIIAVEIIYVRPFHPEWSNTFEISRTLIFLAGILLLILTDLYLRISSFRGVDRMVKTQQDLQQENEVDQISME